MNDRLTIAAMSNSELRTAIRETEKTCGETINEAHKMAEFHLAALRKVERARAATMADAPLAKAGADEPIPDLRGHVTMLMDKNIVQEQEIARLKSELERLTAPLTDGECDDVALDMRVSDYENIRKWDRAISAVKAGRGK